MRQVTEPSFIGVPYHPHSSSGEIPFFLMYGCDCQLPTGLDFYAPTIRVPTIESDYAKELFSELKMARHLAKQNIGKVQLAQRTSYDKETCSRLKLDWSFRGPYRVYTVTDTCAHIRPVNRPNDDLITVSLQRLSRCRSK